MTDVMLLAAASDSDPGPDIETFSEQIAGHLFSVGAKAGLAKEKSSGRILKLVDGDERGSRELSFYQKVFEEDCDVHKLLRKFVPPFCGRRVILDREFVVLEDVSCGGQNVMDIKMGAVTWDHLASEEKIASTRSKFQFGMELGFRVLGYRATDDEGRVHVLTKEEAKKLVKGTNMRQLLDTFLSPDNVQLRETRRMQFVKQLHQIRDLMKQQTKYRFVSSSLLFAYGRPAAAGSEFVKVTMIDFAHTFQLEVGEEQVDDNYLNGLETLLKLIE